MIGRIVHVFRDESRTDIGAPEPSNNARSILVSLFYPAQPGSMLNETRQSSYADLFAPASGQALELLAGMGIDPEYMKSLETGIYENAAPLLSDKPYPVVLYSPAFGVVKDMYTYSIAELVTSGHVVVSVGSTYESIFSVFPDGSFVRQSEIVSQIRNTDHHLWKAHLEQRVNDLLFVLNQLEEWSNSNPVATNLFDPSAVSVIGHSLGGAGAFEALQRDSRLRAGVLLDPSFHLIQVERRDRDEAPLLVLRENNITQSELHGKMADEVAVPLLEGVKRLAKSYSGFLSMVKIVGADHMSFCDVPLHFQNPDIGDKHRVINRLVNAFMSQYLNGGQSDYSDLLRDESGPSFYQIDQV